MECQQLIFLGFISVTIALNLPQDDPNQSERQAAIAEIALQIRNEPRFHTVDNMTYQFNDGPLLPPNSLAYNITMKAWGLFLKFRRPNREEITEFATKYPINTISDYDAMYDAMSPMIRRPISSIDATLDSSFADDRLKIKGFRLNAVSDPNVFKDRKYGKALSDRQVQEICSKPVANLVAHGQLFHINLTFVNQFYDPARPSKYAPGAEAFFCVKMKKEQKGKKHKKPKRKKHKEHKRGKSPEGEFVPLAIYLDDNGIMYTPFDASNDWMLAKMAFNVAENNVQQFDHFIDCHLLLEPMKVEMLRHLSPKHPVYTILDHHFLQIWATTRAGLLILLSKDSPFDNVMGWGVVGTANFLEYELPKASFRKLDFENLMASRGLNNIPHYKYRDDSRVLIRIFKRFLTKYLGAYYTTDNKLMEDSEIQGFAKACQKQLSDFPESFSSLSQLVDTLVNIIFRSSIHHHALNSDSAWDVASLPYSMSALSAPLPTKKGTHFDLMDFVYSKQVQGMMVGVAAGFARPMVPEITLLESYNYINLGDFAAEALAEYNEAMQAQVDKITKREQGQRRPYYNMSPHRLPHYVWI